VARALVVRRQLHDIFAFRARRIAALFPPYLPVPGDQEVMR
jgi:hypothetical protein